MGFYVFIEFKDQLKFPFSCLSPSSIQLTEELSSAILVVVQFGLAVAAVYDRRPLIQ